LYLSAAWGDFSQDFTPNSPQALTPAPTPAKGRFFYALAGLQICVSVFDILYQNQAWRLEYRYTVPQRSMAMVRILLSTRLGERRLTQADLARMTGIRKNTISELYNEIATRVSLDHLDLICEALGCGLTDLLEITPNAEPRVKTRTGAPLPGKGGQ
jgi:putative transcriptional regulator